MVVVTGDWMNLKASSDVRPPSFCRCRGFSLRGGKEQNIGVELLGNEGACKPVVVLVDLYQGSEVLVSEVR